MGNSASTAEQPQPLRQRQHQQRPEEEAERDHPPHVAMLPHPAHSPRTRRIPRSLVARGGQLLDASDARQTADLTEVKNAWRAFKGWDLGSKLSLGMSLSEAELHYLKGQVQRLPACFRPSKLHFWDNTTHSARNTSDNQGGASRHVVQRLQRDLLRLCQTSVREVEWHGFGGVPPLDRLDVVAHEDENESDETGSPGSSESQDPLSSASSPRGCVFTHLECARVYHLNLTGRRAGRVLRHTFLTGGRRLHTLYLARCRLDLECIEELGRGLAQLPRLKTLVFVHCQMTDDMLERLLHCLSESLQNNNHRMGGGGVVQPLPPRGEPAAPQRPDGQAENHNPPNENDIQAHNDLNNEDNPEEDDTTTATTALLDLCVHANRLTVRSIGILARFLAQHDVLRSVTLHANPHIDALLTSNENDMESPLQSCPELSHFLEVLQTQNTSLRHFSWHNCVSTTTTDEAPNQAQQHQQPPHHIHHCEACQQMAQIFSRNRWLALSHKLCNVLTQTHCELWPYLLAKLSGRRKPHPLEHTAQATALWNVLQQRHVELAAVRCTDVQHFWNTTLRDVLQKDDDDDGLKNKDQNSSMSCLD